MPLVNPTYLEASDGSQWLLACADGGTGPTETPVTGQIAVPYVGVNSVTDGKSWQISILPTGQLQSQSVLQSNYPLQLLVNSPDGTSHGIQIATVGGVEGIIQVAPPLGSQIVAVPLSISKGHFTKLILAAPGPYFGVRGSLLLSCSPGDKITLTATARWLSGTMRPIVGVWFWDQPLSNNVGAIQISPPNTDTGWHVANFTATVPAGAAVMEVGTWCEALAPGADSYFAGFVSSDSGVPPPALPGSPTGTSWEVSDYRIAQNGNFVHVPLDTFDSLLTTAAWSKDFIFPLYYLSLLTSQYKQAANLYAWLATLVQPATDLFACLQQAYQAFDLDLAAGAQLDTLGQIVGAARTLPYQPSTGEISAVLLSGCGTGAQTVLVNNTIGMFVGATATIGRFFLHHENVVISAVNPGVSFTATFAHIHFANETVTSAGVNINPTLGDADYRMLLRAKIAQNQWDGSIDSLYALWNQLFPQGRIVFIDNQNMTALIVLAGIFTALQQSMIVNGLIVPRPQAVLYDYSFAQLPLFGFDQNNATIAGFDAGHFA